MDAQDHAQDCAHDYAHNRAQVRAPDGFQIALENEVQVLYWIWRFGWLSTRMLATLIWDNPGSRMPRITLSRMSNNNLVLSKRIGNGTPIYTLSHRGALRLRAEYPDISARSGKDIRIGNWYHRAVSNIALIHALCMRPDGIDIYTEHEIQSSRVEFMTRDNQGCNQWRGKVPDGLIVLHQGDERELIWIEVDLSRRSAKDLRRLSRFITGWLSDTAVAHNIDVLQVRFLAPAVLAPRLEAVGRWLFREFPREEDRRIIASDITTAVFPIRPSLVMQGNEPSVDTIARAWPAEWWRTQSELDAMGWCYV